ncbi:MAG: Hsp70 family protein [candidate division Zixibacteria bacterium]|nr:Hsp70 family protein [candidate division Zixibacteria bacterium]
MISSVEIKNFRGIREGKLEGLAPLTVLVGPNGSGKSTILDALLIGASPAPGDAIGRAVRRHQWTQDGARWLFWRANEHEVTRIVVRTEAEAMRSCDLKLTEPQPKNALGITAGLEDKATGKTQNVRIEASSGLSEKEIERMVNDAKTHEAEDKQRREKADARNSADQQLFASEKNLKEYADKLEADDKSRVDAGNERLKKAFAGDDIDETRSAAAELNQIWQALSAKLYQGATSNGAGQSNGAADESGEESQVRDAEFEEVK